MSGDLKLVLTLSCPDKHGIVAAVAGALAGEGCNILDSAQFYDPETGLFFMRVAIAAPGPLGTGGVEAALAPVAGRYAMRFAVHETAGKARLIVLVSRFDHCLEDLLYRMRVGALPIEIVAIVSNHTLARETAERARIPFHHWPVTRETKPQVEARLVALVEAVGADLVVLARYMQVLSADACRALEGKVINIHHSFLPAFKGAKPYSQAHARGVKLIGATAHYATADLDEGPIIEQDAERVTHAHSAEDLMVRGRDIEARVLARAVRYHVEHRVFLNGIKTVVFD